MKVPNVPIASCVGVALLVMVGGCAPNPYTTRALVEGKNANLATTVGCIDIKATDAGLDRAYKGDAAVIDLRFGNWCEHPVSIDFSAIKVSAHVEGKPLKRLRLFDPRGVVGPRTIGALMYGQERFAYDYGGPIDGRGELCLDLRWLTPPAQEATQRICLPMEYRTLYALDMSVKIGRMVLDKARLRGLHAARDAIEDKQRVERSAATAVMNEALESTAQLSTDAPPEMAEDSASGSDVRDVVEVPQ